MLIQMVAISNKRTSSAITSSQNKANAGKRDDWRTTVGDPFVWLITVFVLEGALRKWGPPQTAQFFFFLKDVPAAWCLWRGRHRLAKNSSLMRAIVVLFLLLMTYGAAQVVIGRANVLLFVLDLHSLIGLPFYAAAAWAALANRRTSFGGSAEVLLLAGGSIQLLLVIAQVLSPPNAYVNRIFADDGVGNFFLTADLVRATGTFTSTAGLTVGLTVLLSISLARLSSSQQASPIVCATAVATTSIAAALSGSRTALVTVATIFLAYLVVPRARDSLSISKVKPLVFAALGLGLGSLLVFGNYYTALVQRFADANQSEDPASRLVSYVTSWIPQLYDSPFLGAGIGVAGNASVAVSGKGDDTWIESDYTRIVFELGPVGGTLMILARFLVVGYCLRVVLRAVLDRDHQSLPIAISAVSIILLQSVWSQGDVTLAGGILLGLLAARHGQMRRLGQ